MAMRPDSDPPAASQRWAAVWRSRWGRSRVRRAQLLPASVTLLLPDSEVGADCGGGGGTDGDDVRSAADRRRRILSLSEDVPARGRHCRCCTSGGYRRAARSHRLSIADRGRRRCPDRLSAQAGEEVAAGCLAASAEPRRRCGSARACRHRSRTRRGRPCESAGASQRGKDGRSCCAASRAVACSDVLEVLTAPAVRGHPARPVPPGRVRAGCQGDRAHLAHRLGWFVTASAMYERSGIRLALDCPVAVCHELSEEARMTRCGTVRTGVT